MGWQLPQLLIAGHLARQTRYKPLTIKATIHERIPFFGLAIIALSIPTLGPVWSLILIFLLLTWQGFGAGFTANPWQNLINKVIPANSLATFFGVQTAALNLFASGSAIIAGLILERARQVGIAPEDVIFDPLALTVGADSKAGLVTLETAQRLRDQFGVNQTLGASNISFGLPERDVINWAFLTMVIQAGVTCPVVNAEKVRAAIRSCLS